MRDRIVREASRLFAARGVRATTRSFAEAIGTRFPDVDPEALAFLFVGPLIFFRMSDWLTG